ncbi:MAG: YtxH domain-containing protein [Chloroflexota bacterium]|nr:YtxH domain-containing protein [Chloroflexota bacterium]
MLKGLRSALKFFTLGLLAGLLLAPRKGDDTRALLLDRGREYFKELVSSGRQAAGGTG